MVRCGLVWGCVMCFGVVWAGVLWCGAVRCGIVLCCVVLCCVVLCVVLCVVWTGAMRFDQSGVVLGVVLC